MKTQPIKIVLADDHTLFRQGMVEVLGKCPEFKIVGEAADGQKALELIRNQQPDIALLDLEMPVLNGLDVLKRLLDEKAPVKCIVVSMHYNKLLAAKCTEYGARGFIHKSDDVEDVLLAITNVYHNGVHITEEKYMELPQPLLLQPGFGDIDNDRNCIFSTQELEVLHHLKEGLTSQKTGEKMHLGRRTIEDIRQRMMEKARVHNVAALIQFALKNEIIA